MDSTNETKENEIVIPREIERRNASIFFFTWQLLFLIAPVYYVGVLQAALCDKLGAGPAISNLPTSLWLVGFVTPFFVTRIIPLRLEGRVLMWTTSINAISMTFVCAALVLPVGNNVRIAVIVCQMFVYGILGSTSGVYIFQCLGRGTTKEGRAKTLKWTFSVGPLVAVGSSLGAQYVLNGGFKSLPFPYDFALLYFIGVPCMFAIAILSSRYDLPAAEEVVQPPVFSYIKESVTSFVGVRSLVILWLGYFLWYCVSNAMPNFSLYTREVIGRDPKELAGAIQALRFGFKACAGFLLGVIALRWGVRAPIVTTMLVFVAAIIWGWTVPGYAYLIAFGFMGAAELGAAYFLNYAIANSSPANGARNIALLQLAVPASSISPVLHGVLTGRFGFPASFTFALATALVGLWLVYRLPVQIAAPVKAKAAEPEQPLPQLRRSRAL
jgi:MFS family permease